MDANTRCSAQFYVNASTASQLNESRTADLLFDRLIRELYSRCSLPPDRSREQLLAARATANFLIRADICTRLMFLLHLVQHHKDITPEQMLLAQLYDSNPVMVTWWRRLVEPTKPFSLAQLTALMDYCHAELRNHIGDIRVALDEAQVAARLFNDRGCFHCPHIDHARTNDCGGLLHAYTTMWRLYATLIIVTGTNMVADTEHDVPSGFGKGGPTKLLLPYLHLEDVQYRLKKVLDVSDEDLVQVHNLHKLTGRCRWVAALVAYLTAHKERLGLDGKRQTRQGAVTWKANVLVQAIDDFVREVRDDMSLKIGRVLAQLDPRKSKIPHILQRLHAVHWLFHYQAAGLQQMFAADELLDLHGNGVVLLTDVEGDFVAVALDPIGANVLEGIGIQQRWAPADLIAERLANAQGLNPVQLVYEFETLVAAALVQYEGTVADLVTAANGGVLPDKLPEWTEDASLKNAFKYHICKTAAHSKNAIEHALSESDPEKNTLVHCDDLWRPDYFALVRRLLQNGSMLAFLFMASAKLWSRPVPHPLRESDLESTILENGYSNKPVEWRKGNAPEEDRNRAQENFAPLVDSIRAITGQRELRLHVILPGYAYVQHGNKFPEDYDDDTRKPQRVFISGQKVRVVIDCDSYTALFGNSRVGEVAKKLINRKLQQGLDWLGIESKEDG